MKRPSQTATRERVVMLTAQVNSLFARADALDRVANELRTEAAAVGSGLLELSRDLDREDSRASVRAALTAMAGAAGLRVAR